MKFAHLLALSFSLVVVDQTLAQASTTSQEKGWYVLSNAPGFKGYGRINENGWLVTEQFQNIETGAVQDAKTGEWTASKLPEEKLGPAQLYRSSTGGLYMAQQIQEGGPHVGKWRLLYRVAEPAQLVQQAVAGYQQYQQYSSIPGGQIGQFLSILNGWRAQHGRHAIGWDQNLANYAATNNGVHAPHSTGGAAQCWAGTHDLIASLYMWFNSPAHASILLNAQSAVGAAPCPTGATANAR